MSGERQALNELLDELVQEARDVERYATYDRHAMNEAESRAGVEESRAKIVAQIEELSSALRSAREDSARLRKSLAWLVEYMDDGIDAFSASHDCEFTTNPDRGKCDFCEAWAEAVEVSAVSLPQPERDEA